jgi:hypothetical protein
MGTDILYMETVIAWCPWTAGTDRGMSLARFAAG